MNIKREKTRGADQPSGGLPNRSLSVHLLNNRLLGIAILAVLILIPSLSACVSLPEEKTDHGLLPPILRVSINLPCAEAAQPAAVFFLPPEGKSIPVEVTQSLREVLQNLHGQKNILFTLETLPDANGSLEVNLGVARRALNQLRDKLVELGVRSYRIKTLIRGEPKMDNACSGKIASASGKQRVELFLSSLSH